MTRRTWCTPEQRAWLDNLLSAFLKAKETRSTADFIADTTTKYVNKWPLDPPTEKEIADASNEKNAAEHKIYENLESHVKNWFNNHARAWTPTVGSRQVLKLGAAPKLVQSWQAYLNLYWENELKEKVDAEWNTYLAGPQEEGIKLNMTKFQLRNAKVQEWYAEASPDIKLKVEEHRHDMKAKGLVGNSENESFQCAINKLPRTLQIAAEALARQTGWHVEW